MQKISSNFFLDSLSLESRRILMDLATTVSLPLGTVLHEAQVIPDHAFLLTSGIASTITKTRNGDSAEVGLIGHEGVVGSLQLLGPAPLPAESMIQIDATALRIRLQELRKIFNRRRKSEPGFLSASKTKHSQPFRSPVVTGFMERNRECVGGFSWCRIAF